MVSVNANVILRGVPVGYDEIAELLQAIAAQDGYVLAEPRLMVTRDQSGLARFSADCVKEMASVHG